MPYQSQNLFRIKPAFCHFENHFYTEDRIAVSVFGFFHGQADNLRWCELLLNRSFHDVVDFRHWYTVYF